MDNSLTRYVGGSLHKVPREERVVVATGKDIRNDVRLAAFKGDAAMALAARYAEGLVELHGHMKDLSKGDAALEMLVGEIFGTCVGQVKKYQRNLFNPWGF